jgi:CPA2 family monovalent cation:H+ antiporter-2
MEHLLRDVVVVMAACLIASVVLGRLKVPTLVGFLVAGIVIGPGGLGFITDKENIGQMAEIGVVFLLFTIGLQFSVSDLLQLRRYVLIGGLIQMGVTTALVTGIALAFGQTASRASFLGVLVALSSTAILLRLLTERGEVNAPHGRFGLGVSIFQDLAVVPLILFLPLWGEGSGMDLGEAWLTLGRSVGLLVAIFLGARFLFPWFMERVVRARSREAFTLATLLGALGTAWLCGQAHVSLSLGAFLAGIVLADSAYAHQVLSEITPLKDALSSLFFASVGMFVAPALWVDAPLLSLGLVTGTIVVKTAGAWIAAAALRLSARASLLGAVSLAQIGEFSFVLGMLGVKEGLFPPEHRPHFFSVAVLSMAATPFLLRAATAFTARRGRADHPPEAHAGGHGGHGAGLAVGDHVIVVGYGVNGRNVTRLLQSHAVDHVVLEMNPATVRRIRGEVQHVAYGDATQEEVLHHAGIADARVLVVAIPDPAAARQIVAVAKKLRPDLVVVVRTRLVAEVEALRRLGATSVVPEELETSLELAGRALAAFGVSEHVVAREKSVIRREGYGLLLQQAAGSFSAPSLDDLLAEIDVTYVALPRHAAAAGRSLLDLDLRRRTGATVVAITRDGVPLANPGSDTVLLAGDVVAAIGTREQILLLRKAFEESVSPEAAPG